MSRALCLLKAFGFRTMPLPVFLFQECSPFSPTVPRICGISLLAECQSHIRPTPYQYCTNVVPISSCAVLIRNLGCWVLYLCALYISNWRRRRGIWFQRNTGVSMFKEVGVCSGTHTSSQHCVSWLDWIDTPLKNLHETTRTQAQASVI